MRSYVLDASALLAFLERGPGAAQVNELLKQGLHGRAPIFMSAANFGEVYGTILRERGPEQARAALAAIYLLPIVLENVTSQRALQAAEVKAKYKLYYVDSFAAALATEFKATLVTSDSDFRRLGHNFPVVWLKA
jgi:predicted nucleic acid-binding protein